jgi:hypothetical protein
MNIKLIGILLGLLFLISLRAQSTDTLKVLFIGNSHTYYNNMPALFDSLSQCAGRPVITAMSAPGSYTLEEHSTLTVTLGLIYQGTWNYVVLQEQSQIPTIHNLRFNSMYPAARRLDSMIKLNNESTAFFMTWGWKYGGQMIIGNDSSPYFVNYFHMQESVRVAYESIATELSALLCPVGVSWKRARTIDTLVDLWAEDNYHPSLKGSYLTACVFYSVFFHSSPVGLSYTAGLSPDDAFFCQNVAWQTISGLEENRLPLFALRQPLKIYPNPFHYQTVIGLPAEQIRSLNIYDISGQLIKSFSYPIPNNQIIWDGKDNLGKQLPKGIYFVYLKTNGYKQTKKVILTD